MWFECVKLYKVFKMKIYIPTGAIENKIGGGHTFTRNFLATCSDVVDTLEECDVFFITGATLVSRSEFELAIRLGKKIAFRVDGVPEDWRNRGTGWSRLRDYAKKSDVVIYQSDFISKTVGRVLGVEGYVIYNGIDTSVFKVDGEKLPEFGKPSVLYCNYRKGEHNKRVEEAIERFRYYKLINPEATMTFVGNYSKQQFLWNKKSWDFGMLDLERDKDWRYLGIVSDRIELATIMRSCQYIAFPSFADPMPNTLIEAMSCGCKPLWINDYGGQKEIVDNWENTDWSRERMTKEYLDAFRSLL